MKSYFKYYFNDLFSIVKLKKKKLSFKKIEMNSEYLLKIKNISKKKYINYYFVVNKNYYHSISNVNKIYLNNFFNIINSIIENKNKILIISNEKKLITPILSKMFSINALISEKNFFFLNKSFMTYPNWLYIYKFFIYKKNVKSLLIIDYLEFKKYLNIFFSLNLIVLSSLPLNFKPDYLDFFFFTTTINYYINKIFIINYFSMLFFNNFNINIIKCNLVVFKKFKNIGINI